VKLAMMEMMITTMTGSITRMTDFTTSITTAWGRSEEEEEEEEEGELEVGRPPLLGRPWWWLGVGGLTPSSTRSE
jgi:hypothetical protein